MMKSLAALGVFVLANGKLELWLMFERVLNDSSINFKVILASPLDRSIEDISPLVEVHDEVEINDPQHRWALVPDGSGRMHLMDLDAYQPDDTEPFFNADADVFFMLFTQRNPTSGQRIGFDADAIRNSNFNSAVPTRFVIHGWNNDHQSDVNKYITEAFVQRGDFNIVSGWSKTFANGFIDTGIKRLSSIGAREPTPSITSQRGIASVRFRQLQRDSSTFWSTTAWLLSIACSSLVTV